MNKDENFKLLLTNILMWKRVFIKKLEYNSMCIIEKTYMFASHKFVKGMKCFSLQ